MNFAVIVSLITAAVGSLGAYLVAARRFGGKINTSEAASLWTEAGNLRKEYKKEIDQLRSALEAVTLRLADMEKRNGDLYLENGNLRRMVEEHEKTITDLREDNQRLRRRVDELEAANG